MSVYVIARRLQRKVSNLVFRTPIERIALMILAVSLATGIAVLIEPGWSLRFRRGVNRWKVVPFLCGVRWIRSSADMGYRIANVPTVSVLLQIAEMTLTCLLLPVVAFMTTVTNPLIARSVVILVGLPAVMMVLCCRLPTRLTNRLPGINVLLTWLVTAIIVGMFFMCCPAVLRWAVSDMSMTVYLALLAAVLTGTIIQERLTVSLGDGRRACHAHVLKFTLYLLASVCAMWIIHCSDTGHAALGSLRDVNRMRLA